MMKWIKVGDRYELRAGLLCGHVIPQPGGEFSWYIAGSESGCSLTPLSFPGELELAKLGAEEALRVNWLAFGDSFYQPLAWQEGPPDKPVKWTAKLDSWVAEVMLTGWWDVSFRDASNAIVLRTVPRKSRSVASAMRDAEVELRSLYTRFRPDSAPGIESYAPEPEAKPEAKPKAKPKAKPPSVAPPTVPKAYYEPQPTHTNLNDFGPWLGPQPTHANSGDSGSWPGSHDTYHKSYDIELEGEDSVWGKDFGKY